MHGTLNSQFLDAAVAGVLVVVVAWALLSVWSALHTARLRRVIQRFRFDGPEPVFNARLADALRRRLGARVDRESAIASPRGGKTLIDLVVLYRGVEFLVTVKNGLNAQQLKTLKGELEDFPLYWSSRRRFGAKIIVLIYNVKESSVHLSELRHHLSKRLRTGIMRFHTSEVIRLP